MSNPEIKVYDNFLSAEKYHSISDPMLSPFFPWYFHDAIVYDTAEEVEDPRMFQFSHIFFDRVQMGDTFRLLQPFVEKMKPSSLIRVKANLQPNTETIRQNPFHIDYKHSGDYENAKTAIYYVNTNNGKTVFEDGTKVDSVANRLVVFNPRLKHAGTTCTDQKCRIVINFNYYVL